MRASRRTGHESPACETADLYVIDIAQAAQRRLTTGGSGTLSHGLAEFVAQEEMDRHSGYWCRRTRKWIAYEEADTKGVEVLHIADPMHPRSRGRSWPYPRPGKSNAEVRLGVVSAAGGATTWVSWDRAKYPYLARVVWTKSSPLTLVVQNREQTEELLLAADPQSGKTTTLLAETDSAWLNLSEPTWLEDGSGFLWLSEKSGETRLELHRRDGQFENFVTPPSFGLREVLGTDLVGKKVFVSASLDPTERQVWSAPLSGKTPIALSQGAGTHTAVFARDVSASAWTETAVSGERSWSVRRRDGTEAARLRSVAEAPPFQAVPEFVTIGERGYHAAIVRPRNFQAGRKYPVLLSAYTGPTVQTVLQDPWGYLLSQWMADHGFIVVTLDGRGTPGRGRDWERVIKGNLIDIELNDQVEGIQALGAKYGELDLARVGVYGWSFGGYFSAMAAMRRPDVFKAAIAGAPVCDWRDYDTHYTERYMGLPQQNEGGYAKSSVLTYTGDLKIPLLIVHGTADDNVYFLNSLRMTDALFRPGNRTVLVCRVHPHGARSCRGALSRGPDGGLLHRSSQALEASRDQRGSDRTGPGPRKGLPGGLASAPLGQWAFSTIALDDHPALDNHLAPGRAPAGHLAGAGAQRATRTGLLRVSRISPRLLIRGGCTG